MAVSPRRIQQTLLDNNSTQDACRLVQKCATSLGDVCDEIDQYIGGGGEVETNIVLLPPAYLELMRRRDNLVATIASIIECVGRHDQN